MPGVINTTVGSRKGTKSRNLDVVFVHDSTGSQDPYLHSATQETRNYFKLISDGLKNAKHSGPKGTARFRLIAFRDHREQGDAWTIKDTHDFTSDPDVLEKQLKALRAEGGGDGPEAQLDALDAALRSAWRGDAQKVVFLITDSPPHGVEPGDRVPKSQPSSINTPRIVSDYRKNDIMLFVLGCVPEINTYKRAVHYYKQMVKDIGTGGAYVPMKVASTKDSARMRFLVVGSALNAYDVAHIEHEYHDWIIDQANSGHDAKEIAKSLHGKLKKEGHKCHEIDHDHSGHCSGYHHNVISHARVQDIVDRALDGKRTHKKTVRAKARL
ncbi:VWFA domain-containing protein [Mycena indigotica]|uniref:VWFA domain-containing protein n=1 Tax=Mycena indigotica TaxID=2126181 RepID=A0A8H6S852_9AGAR|nr:VWFA domain-containing protein [Mycena indigotica]KAF7293050.1 VWFA domain-containing protein [Mycena indigotica]